MEHTSPPSRLSLPMPRPPELIDTHCHLDVADFAADRDAVLARARTAGVVAQVIPAIAADGWHDLCQLCQREPDLYPALGLHPVYVADHRGADLVELERMIAERAPVAIGEIGLDFFVPGLDRERQQALFEAQLAIARSADLPVLLHVRRAHDQVLATLRRHPVRGGIVHAFNGSVQQAERYRELGFLVGFGGMLTFARSTRLRRLATAVPIEAIVLETDAPDLTVASHQGERNSPEYLPEVLAALAEVRGEDPAWLAARTTANARALLRL
ncbi:TatD family hydrolase [Thioalkalicoccus limnaeus]|uniref:TatD family hydrolase n=1 Tax=Thioalkalicoccus limnaeus TaxID=120681 RepID=A0ABV4BI55_9GAMM